MNCKMKIKQNLELKILYKNALQKFRVEKVIKKKGNSYMSSGKTMTISLTIGLIRNTIKMCVNQNKTRIIINADVSVKNCMIEFL